MLGFFAKYGFKGLTIIFFGTIILLVLCIKGCVHIEDDIPFKWAGINCGCGSKEITVINTDTLNKIQEKIIYMTDSISYIKNKVAALEETIAVINNQLTSEKDINESLIQQRDSLQNQIDILNIDLAKYIVKLDSLNEQNNTLLKQIDSISEINQTQIKESEEKTILDSINNKMIIDSLNRIHTILNKVFITNMYAQRIDPTTVRVNYELSGVEILKANGYDETPPIIKLMVKDIETDTYIEHIEGKKDIRKYNSGTINYTKYSSGIIKDNINFTNTEKEPFGRMDKFRFEIYLEGFDRPLGTQQQNLRSSPRVIQTPVQ